MLNPILHHSFKLSLQVAHQVNPSIGISSLKETANLVAMPEHIHESSQCHKQSGKMVQQL